MSLVVLPCIPATEWRPPELVGSTRTSGRSASGVVAASRTDGGGIWRAGFTTSIGRDKDRARVLHAIKAYLAEGSRPIVVPFYRENLQPWPTVDGEMVEPYGSLPHSDDTFFSDGSGYYQPVIEVQTASLAVLRATQLSLTKIFSGNLRGGELFSIDHTELRHRIYRIRAVDDQTDSTATVTIEPPLREAVAASVRLEFDIPKCVMQLDGSDAFPISMRHPAVPSASLAFIESFLPLD